MAISHIENGDSGAVSRGIINEVIDEVNVKMPTAVQKAAMTNANSPTAFNPFATMADLGGGFTPTSVGRTLFVDEIYGDDGTAVPNSRQYPFQTVPAAFASITGSGDMIYVITGNYSASGLSADQCPVWCDPGVTISGSYIFTDAGVSNSFNICGFGKFIASAAIVYMSGTDSQITITGSDFRATGGARAFDVDGGNGKIYAQCLGNVYASQNAIARISTTDNAYISVKAERMFVDVMGVELRGGDVFGDIYMEAKSLTMTDNTTGSIYTMIGCAGGNSCILDIKEIRSEFDSAYGIGMIYQTGGNIVINGNTTFLNGAMAIQKGGGTLELNGKFQLDGRFQHNAGMCYLRKRGDMATNFGLEFNGGQVIQYDLINFTGSRGVLLAANGYTGKQGASIYCSTSAVCMDGNGASFTALIYPGMVSNVPADGTVTQQISTILVDANVSPEQ